MTKPSPLRVARRHDAAVRVGNRDFPADSKELLLDLLALLRAQHWLFWNLHWVTKGPNFYGNHLLFERLYDGEDDDGGLKDDVDGLAERIVGYCGPDAIDPLDSMLRASAWVEEWTEASGDVIEQALQSETDFQAFADLCYHALEQEGSLSLGLDDFIAALAGRHDTSQYLLGQVAAGVRVAAKSKIGAKVKKLWLVSDPGNESEVIDIVSEVGPESLVNIAFGVGRSRWDAENYTLHDDVNSAKDDALLRLERLWGRDIPAWVFDEPGSLAGYRSWKPRRVAAEQAAPSAEGEFFDNPEKREVREFAETDALTNIPDVALDAAPELDEPVPEAVEQAEKAPPTPEEIDDEPGGTELSTLNRFVVKSEDPDVKGVPEGHHEVPKHPAPKEASVLPEVRRRLTGWFGD